MRQPHFSRTKYGTPLAVLAALVLAALVGFGFWLFDDLPAISQLEQRKAIPTTVIVDRTGRLLYEVIDPESGRQMDLTLDAVPQACIDATLATEDSRFYHHLGFDPVAISRAMIQNLRAGGTVVSGGSTLTQQLVRILLLEEQERYEQTYRRKMREAWLALRLESRYTKDELLALYLNQSYYGNFAFGLESAAQTFFAKPASHLSAGECALLAGLVQYPSGYNPLVEPEIAKNRQLTVLRLMVESGYLSEPEAQLIAEDSLRFRSNLFNINAPHFVMYARDVAARLVGENELRKGGLRIVTTLDLGLQQAAEASVNRRLDLLNCEVPGLCTSQTNRNRRVDNAAAVVLDASNGDILAMVGSPDYFDETIRGNVNAALTHRQPGSAIKPLTYAAAMDPGWAKSVGVEPLTAASILADLPAVFYVEDETGGKVPYRPLNYDRIYHGPVSVRNALANSYNIPAVKVLDRIGVETLRSIATQAGIKTFTNEYGLALTLGGGEVTLLELTSAFGIFLDGTKLDSYPILDIQRRNANGAWTSLPNLPTHSRATGKAEKVIGADTASLITDILSDNTARIPAFGENSALHLPFDVAAKTGTTTDWRDNWTVGYSTERLVGVWVGNADNEPMLDVSGIDGAGPIWRDIMLAAHPTDPPPFIQPANIVSVQICAPSGDLPSDACTQRRVEKFIAGTEPTVVDDQFKTHAIDNRTGLPAGDDLEPQFRGERVFWDLPTEYHEWAAANGIFQLAHADIPVGDDGSGNESLGTVADVGELSLDEPISNTAFQIHPSLPRSNQRILLKGHVTSGEEWETLRLMKDGQILHTVDSANRISYWWTLEPGIHRFVLEGKRKTAASTETSTIALVKVTNFEIESEKTRTIAIVSTE